MIWNFIFLKIRQVKYSHECLNEREEKGTRPCIILRLAASTITTLYFKTCYFTKHYPMTVDVAASATAEMTVRPFCSVLVGEPERPAKPV